MPAAARIVKSDYIGPTRIDDPDDSNDDADVFRPRAAVNTWLLQSAVRAGFSFQCQPGSAKACGHQQTNAESQLQGQAVTRTQMSCARGSTCLRIRDRATATDIGGLRNACWQPHYEGRADE